MTQPNPYISQQRSPCFGHLLSFHRGETEARLWAWPWRGCDPAQPQYQTAEKPPLCPCHGHLPLFHPLPVGKLRHGSW